MNTRYSLMLALAGTALLAGCSQSNNAPAQPEVAPTELAALDTPMPAYPEALACAGIGGKTVLIIRIGPDGRVNNSRVAQSSGQKELDEADSSRVLAEWKVKPATRNGQPVAQTIQVPVNFNPPVPKPDYCFAVQERGRSAG